MQFCQFAIFLVGAFLWGAWVSWGGGAYGLCPWSRVLRAPHLPRFILLANFSGILLVVLILDMISQSMIAICSRFCSPEGVKEISLL